jgi:glyoxylase-like metal-dependent hydrolase (beta-lactamase superfamily II)
MKIDRILANNPGPYTGPGTNTWLLDDGSGSVVVIDPGPVDSRHARAIVNGLGNRTLEAVLVTHTHIDHAPMANPLARDFDVPAVGYAPGPQFAPDIRLLDGATFDVGSLGLVVIHTPGHADDHLCFRAGDALFSGDHMKGGSSVMVESLGPYLDSLAKLKGTGLRRMYPGHGDEMDEPDDVIDWYIAHRRQRHEQVFGAIARGCETVDEIVETVYSEVDSSLHPLAAHSVAAHVELLGDQDRIVSEGGRILVVKP